MSSCFISVVHFSLYLGAAYVGFYGSFLMSLWACSTIFKKWTIRGQLLKLGVGPRIAWVMVSWCAVVDEYNLFHPDQDEVLFGSRSLQTFEHSSLLLSQSEKQGQQLQKWRVRQSDFFLFAHRLACMLFLLVSLCTGF